MINVTSETLLKLISKLVSKDTITRESLSLSQSIQALISKNANQTTLGLGIKLHHHFGSRELISLLHQYGYVCTYDEVQRFRTSVAKYTGERDYTSRGLRKNGKIIASWCDNYDLQVNTPNGQRETHSMAIEWRQQVPDHNDFDSRGGPLVITRLSKEEAKLVQINALAPVKMICYQGPKKLQPPKTTLAEGESYNRTVKKMKSIEHAVQNDIGWLVSIIKSTKEGNTGVEWSGYMASIAHQQDIPLNATKYIFGPRINETPSHPDTVLTTMLVRETFTINETPSHPDTVLTTMLVRETFTAEHGQIYP